VTVKKAAAARMGNSRAPAADRRVLTIQRKGVPEPLRPLGAPGMDAWTRLHEDAGWLTPADLDVAQVFAEMIDERVAMLGELDDTMDSRSRGVIRTSLRRIDEIILKYARDLGVAPAYRAQLGIKESRSEPSSQIERLRQKYPMT